jgi:exosortase A-associated hydrolase 1
LLFEHAHSQLVGIMHHAPGATTDIGVLIVVGGPQYRVGSHRQFVLLARHLAATGYPVLRFDYRGMVDNAGEARDFEAIGEDIGCAVDALCKADGNIKRVVLWGLCDAASANAFYALADPRIVGQIALNPWVKTAEGEARVFIKHYYLQRLMAPALWRKILRFEFDAAASLRDFVSKLRHSRDASSVMARVDNLSLPQRVREAQMGFTGSTLLILSGNDLTAREYEDRVNATPAWRSWTQASPVSLRRLEAADHTFSRAVWRDQVAAWCSEWLRQLAR